MISNSGVGKLEGLAAAAVSSRGEGILSRAAEEEEGKGREVEDGLCLGLIMVLGEAGNEGTEDGDVDRPHPGGWGPRRPRP